MKLGTAVGTGHEVGMQREAGRFGAEIQSIYCGSPLPLREDQALGDLIWWPRRSNAQTSRLMPFPSALTTGFLRES